MTASEIAAGTDAADDTIFALSSGLPPAAIALVRISGAGALAAGRALAGSLPPPRRAGRRRLHGADGEPLDDALVLAFPGPGSATGDDLVELHLHGGRAVVRAVLRELAALPGLRAAEAGEFTRRALYNGRVDLAEAEGLADLLAAESDHARRAALAASEGAVSRAIGDWSARLVTAAARLEAQIDFADEDDLPAEADEVAAISHDLRTLRAELEDALATAPIERLRDGFRIVLAGPPNSGKSSLVNALTGRDVAIVAPIAGTTRDRLEAPVQRAGIPYILTDVAGLRAQTDDPIERTGIARARAAMDEADLVVWLGDEPAPAADALSLHARCDLTGRAQVPPGRLAVSATTGTGVEKLWQIIADKSSRRLPDPDQLSYNDRQRRALAAAHARLAEFDPDDPVMMAEDIRSARMALAAVLTPADIDTLLDELFGRFCIGK